MEASGINARVLLIQRDDREPGIVTVATLGPRAGTLAVCRLPEEEAARAGRELLGTVFVVTMEMPFEGQSYLGTAAELDGAKVIAQADSDQYAKSEKKRKPLAWESSGKSHQAPAGDGCCYLITEDKVL